MKYGLFLNEKICGEMIQYYVIVFFFSEWVWTIDA